MARIPDNVGDRDHDIGRGEDGDNATSSAYVTAATRTTMSAARTATGAAACRGRDGDVDHANGHDRRCDESALLCVCTYCTSTNTSTVLVQY